MKGNRAVLTAVVVVAVLIVGWWLFSGGGSAESVDLLSRFDSAERKPGVEAFSVADVALNGESKRAIAVAPSVGTRITWKVRIPDDGWLRVDLGLKPEVWEQEGDGVLFLVGVSDGRAFDQLFTQHVNPFGNSTDRRWIPVWVDLSAYGGEEIDVIFNTYASPSGKQPDQRNDLAVWGTPAIVVR
jgi:hypothetical protein